MVPLSVWEKESFFAPSDIVIAGSGLVGLWSAYYLKRRAPTLRITIVERGLIHVPQGNRLFPDLTIGECLSLGAYTARARAHEERNRERAIKIFPKLGERWRQRVRTLSGGERQMASIGVALMGDPRLLILDEPTLGLAPKIKDELCAAILDISKGGVPLIVVEQDVEFLLEIAEHLYLINHGRVAAEIKPGQTMDHREIMAMYFGS